MMATVRPWKATMIVRNNYIAENSIHCVASQGGGIFLTFPPGGNYNEWSGRASIEIYNNLIVDNYSQDRGGGIAIWDQTYKAHSIDNPNPLIYNNTIVGNIANEGAGIFNFSMNALLFNNIFWNEGPQNPNGEISLEAINYISYYSNPGRFKAFFNNIKGGYPGIGNIDRDPLIDHETFILAEGSPSVGRGTDSLKVAGNWHHAPVADFAGTNRHQASADGETDQGALESPYDRQVVHYDSDRVINVPSEQPAIQAAINAASEGDTVLVEEGIYYENINFRGKAITVGSKFIINGDEAHIAQTVIDGSQPLQADSASVVTFNSGEDTTSVLKGLTLTGGGGTKAIVNLGENVDFCGGGGIYMGEAGGKIEDNIIIGNRLERPNHRLTAGGIWADGGEADRIIRNNSIYFNELHSTIHAMGAGMLLFSRNGNTIIEGNNVIRNIANAGAGYWSGGGGIMIPSDKPWGGSFIMRNNMITENQAHGTGTTGGGLYFEYLPFSESYQAERSSVEIYNNVIAENVSDHFGGGIGIDDDNNLMENWVHASPVIYNNTIVNNRSFREAGFYNRGAKPLLYNNIFWNECSFVPKGEEFLKNTLFETYNNSIRSGWNPHWDMCAEPEFYEGTYQLTDGNICLGRGTASVEVNGETYYAPLSDMFGQQRITEEKTRIDPGAVWSQSAMTDAFKFVETFKGGEGNCKYTLDMKLAGGVPPYTIYLDGEEQASVPIENVCQGPHIVEVKDAEDNAITWEVKLGVGLNETLAEETISVLYPNPTHGIAHMAFTLEKPAPVCITLFNMLGQQERVVHQEKMLPGRHVAEFDVSDLEPGLYFIRLEGAAVSTHKLIVE
ncbi:MAG: T9SS type A sorting domain-containing protein [Bacteroidales bacterium]|nr:T9SS type A sorting domain-containing protein [Bacteroidales bacterium]